jgi:acyl transferase domain-containing protein
MARIDELIESGSAIAIVGMAAHVPGATSARQFWRNVREGVESIRAVPESDLRAAGVSSDVFGHPDYVPAAAPLPGMESFDAGFFGLNPRDAAVMDPQHRHFLECAWEALEDAGHMPERFAGPIGVFAGSGTNAYFWGHVMTNPDLVREAGFFLLRHTGNDKDFLSTRVSYEFDLTGPSVNVQTACSTSLVAVHLASQSLLLGECDMALAGGVTIELPHGVGYLFKENEILSPDGHCRAFDADAAGTVFGSGAGVVVLRRLEDAVADGDDIRAVVLGSAINNDGAGKVGYLAPSVEGQAKAIAEALTVSGVAPGDVDYVEAHGTGTAVGDPIEVTALTEAFRRTGADGTGFCALGSVKTNIGHLDTAAGVASLIKVVSALEAAEMPPSLHYRSPNPRIDFESSPFRVNAELRAWPSANRPRTAGVSSLGVGGTNAFVLVEEAPETAAPKPGRDLDLLLVSGRNRRVLEAASANLGRFLDDEFEGNLADAAWTLAVGRRGFEHRRAVVAGSIEEAVEALVAGTDGGDARGVVTDEVLGSSPSVAFLFAGGGSQYPGMGAGLYTTEAVYRETVDACLAAMEPDLRERVRAFLLDPDAFPTHADTAAPGLALPALFTTQIAQARLWRSWGVEPRALLGHSMGEYTAACLAGVLSLEDALALVVVRGRLFERVPPGAMLGVNLPESELAEVLPDTLSIAAVNAPEATVASGPPAEIEALARRLEERGIESRRIHIAVAAHSAMLDAILDDFEGAVRSFEFSTPEIPFVSNLSGDWITDAEATDPTYWVRQLRHTVRFADGVARLLDGEPRVLLEVGPGRTLATLARMNRGEDHVVRTFTSMRHPDESAVGSAADMPGDAVSDLARQMGTLGALWTAGVEVDWRAFHGVSDGPPVRRRVSLPTYPFERERHWIEPGRGIPLREGFEGGEVDTPTHDDAREPPGPAAGLSADGRRLATTGDGARMSSADSAAELTLGFYAPGWQAAPVTPAPLPDTGALLVLGPGDAEVIRALERRGRRVMQVVDPDVEALEAAFAALDAEGLEPTAAIHLDLLDPADPGSAMPELSRTRAFDTLFSIVRGLGHVDPDPGFRLLVATSRAVQVEAEEVDPWKSLALGPVRVAPRELPGLETRLLDLPGAIDADAVAGAILEELDAVSDDRVVARRGAERWVETMHSTPAPPVSDAAVVRDGDTWLITGGLGGLGLEVARCLADRAAVNLVLVGRTGLPPRDRWTDTGHAEAAGGAAGHSSRTLRRMDAVRELERRGATVDVLAADLADGEACRSVVEKARARFGHITGLVHAAGTLDDEPILTKSLEAAVAVLAPKVDGLVGLETALAEDAPETVVLFSSRSSTSGLPGQVDYTAANAFLDAWARRERARGRSGVVAIEWDIWRDVGMAADLHASMTGDAPLDAAASEPTPLDHPYFDARRTEADGSVLFTGTLGPDTHWLLDHHRLEGEGPVVPGAGFVEIARSALALCGVEMPCSMRDVMFLSPFAAADGETRRIGARVKTDADGATFEILGRPDDEVGWVEHCTGRADRAMADASARTVDLASLADRCDHERVEVGGYPRNPYLELGGRWANLDTIEVGDGEALLTLTLPDAFRADLDTHHVHPALFDVATASAQSMVEAFHEPGAFHIPASYAEITLRSPLPASVVSHVRLRERLDGMDLFDVTVFDRDGHELLSVEEFVMVRVREGDVLGGAAAGAQVEPRPDRTDHVGVEGIEHGIATEDGIRAFDRILHAALAATPAVGPVVAVSARDLLDVMAALDAGSGPGQGEGGPPPIAVEPLVDVLRLHPAVVDAAAVAHRYGSDEIRIVAFVVYDLGVPSTVSALRRHLRAELPSELVPQNFVEMTEIPRDRRGRVLRDRLPDPFAPRDDHVAPRTDTEGVIAEIWARLMGLSKVSIHDNFLDAGGHSLLGIRALLQIEKRTGVRLHPNQLTMQTLEQLAAEIDRRAAETGGSRDGEAASGDAPGLQDRMKAAFRQIVRGS